MANAIADRLISKGFKVEAVSKITEEMASYYNRLHALGNKITKCDACSLRDGCKAPIPGLGPLNPEILVVSDHPLNSKDSTGMMEMSMFMMTFFSRLGLKIEDIYWTHAVKCPSDRHKNSHIQECHVHLVNEIAVLQPAVIIALGTTAISSLAGEYIHIKDAIGGEFEFEVGSKSIPVIPLYHPRLLMDLSAEEIKPKVNEIWTNIQQIVDYL